ncbi:Lrp/AsnC family transcriptional regulator [Thalassolituus sp. LLYu03]|uniref:Lrp/AsnC family transcriptional regulator n=1 Tax=Thalassolituus sp. LLYu03 TaxID=3421656 RepID=UPI003D2654D9
MQHPPLSELQKAILDRYQQSLPASLTPFADMATALNCSETDVINALNQLLEYGVVKRFGPVFDHQRAGASTLVAMAVDAHKLEEEALRLNAFAGLNHNYEREHQYNLWFVLTASSEQQLQLKLQEICACHPWPVLILPMEQSYHINLGFPLQWTGSQHESATQH